jgi:hypothetical protein
MMVQIHNVTETSIQLPLNKTNLIENASTSTTFESTFKNLDFYKGTTFKNLDFYKGSINYLNISTLWFPVL